MTARSRQRAPRRSAEGTQDAAPEARACRPGPGSARPTDLRATVLVVLEERLLEAGRLDEQVANGEPRERARNGPTSPSRSATQEPRTNVTCR